MTPNRTHMWLATWMGVAFVFILGSATTDAQSPDVLRACVSPGQGQLRLIGANGSCRNGEQLVVWSVVGPQGPPGEQGDPGEVGPVGPQGPAGPAGPTGPAGADGAVGPAGPAGADGAAGLVGAEGATGPAGQAGATGATGATGPEGPAGATGATGLLGLTGAAGPQGVQGEKGDQGQVGLQGPPGLKGDRGEVGPAGSVGPQGASGASAAVTKTTVITFGEPESVAFMTTSRTSSGVPYVSSYSLPEIQLPGASFTPIVPAVAGGLPYVLVRSGWDFRPAPAYDFIVEDLMQVAARALLIKLDYPTRFFAFSAALNSSTAPGAMSVELLDADDRTLGVFAVHLRATALSRFGGTNSNTEGTYFISGIGEIASVVITNKGDGSSAESQWNWALDNVTFDKPPSP